MCANAIVEYVTVGRKAVHRIPRSSIPSLHSSLLVLQPAIIFKILIQLVLSRSSVVSAFKNLVEDYHMAAFVLDDLEVALLPVIHWYLESSFW